MHSPSTQDGRTSERAAFAVSIRTAAFALALSAGSLARAQVPQNGLLPWSKVKEIVQKFDEVSLQPPPLETILLGTFDAASGVFIWGPDLDLLEMEIDLPYDDVVDVENTFSEHGIEPFDVQFDPYITGLTSVGLALNSTSVSSPGATVHPKPGHAAGKGGVPAVGSVSSGSKQRFRGHPLDKGVMQVFATAAKIAFVVEIVNRPSSGQAAVLTIDGTSAQSTGDTVDVIVPPRTWHSFKIAAGAQAFADKMLVERPPQIGCFTLEALPLALIYEPPGGKECKQTYTSIRRAGTELRTFQSSDSTDTAPVDTPFSTMMGYVEIAGKIGGAAQNVPDPRVKAAGTAVQGAATAIQAAFGSMQVSQDITNTVTDTHTLSIQLGEGRETTTAEGLGPGQGDVFHFLVKPTFAWLVAQDKTTGNVYVTTALLGYEGIASYSARSLRAHTMPVPPAAMQDLLLALDPMAPEFVKPKKQLFGLQGRAVEWDPNSPAPGRLVMLDAPMEYVSGASPSFWVSHTVEQQDAHATIDVTTTTTTSQAGFLSYVSKGVPKDGESRVSVAQGSSATTSSSETVEVKVELTVADGTDGLMLEIWYDRLFGTFAFRDLSVQAQSQALTGTASDDSGAPLSEAPVLMRLPDRRTVRTFTDAQGRFKFRPPVQGAAALMIEAGGGRTRVDWTGVAVANVSVRGAAQAASNGSSTPPKKKKGGGATWPPSGDSVPVTVKETADTAIALRGKPPHGDAKRVAELLSDVEELQRTVRALEARLAALGGPAAETGAPAKKGGPADASAAKSAGPAVIEPDPTLKGRMGRLSIQFPDGAKASASLTVFREGSDKAAVSQYNTLDAELLPGSYNVVVNNRRVEGVEVKSGHVSRLRVGVLRVQLSKDTGFELYEPGGQRAFFSTYGAAEVGLTPGTIEIEVAGQREKVVIRAGEILDF